MNKDAAAFSAVRLRLAQVELGMAFLHSINNFERESPVKGTLPIKLAE